MRFVIGLVLCCCLLGCASPSPEFMDGASSRHQIGENQFSVHVKADRVQAIRTNFAKRPDIRLVARQAELAIEAATGCPATHIYGDVALMEARIDCTKPLKDGDWAAWSKPRRSGLRCAGYGDPSRWGDWTNIKLDCS